ncbi:MAG: hypothetical protein ACJAS7_000335 [Alpinimonas sp.]|jgi:hypothetical protein
MPLSEHEQRLLDEMERGLYGREADVVLAPTSESLRPNYRAIVIGVLVVAVGLGALVVGVITQMVVVGVIGFAVMFTGALVAARPAAPLVPDSLSDIGRTSGKSGKNKAKGSATFMQRMEARWDDRQDGRL